jgi:hypothetical protein
MGDRTPKGSKNLFSPSPSLEDLTPRKDPCLSILHAMLRGIRLEALVSLRQFQIQRPERTLGQSNGPRTGSSTGLVVRRQFGKIGPTWRRSSRCTAEPITDLGRHHFDRHHGPRNPRHGIRHRRRASFSGNANSLA